ncbi:uncharacterized protein LOC116971545 [Amblyraja radiata]|uniref:uncharacterized protein LOC116971545 n=1 Tax=Amblyraja radiata TaxID=386614 RepID=UPI001403EE4F|nr:uncharacterized protein LOC116971545 [Amblyraja radiata]
MVSSSSSLSSQFRPNPDYRYRLAICRHTRQFSFRALRSTLAAMRRHQQDLSLTLPKLWASLTQTCNGPPLYFILRQFHAFNKRFLAHLDSTKDHKLARLQAAPATDTPRRDHLQAPESHDAILATRSSTSTHRLPDRPQARTTEDTTVADLHVNAAADLHLPTKGAGPRCLTGNSDYRPLTDYADPRYLPDSSDYRHHNVTAEPRRLTGAYSLRHLTGIAEPRRLTKVKAVFLSSFSVQIQDCDFV